MSIEEKKEKILIDASIEHEDFSEEIYTLIKDEDTDEYYLTVSFWGWKQVSEIQRNFAPLIEHRYYVKREIVPLLYYILATDVKKIGHILEFLYNENFIYPEEDEQ